MKVMMLHYRQDRGGGAESSLRDLSKALEMCGVEVVRWFGPVEGGIKLHRPDIVHVQTVHCVGWGRASIEWLQKNNYPHLLALHDYWPFCSGRMLLRLGDMSCAAVDGVCDGNCDNVNVFDIWGKLVNNSPTVTFNPYSVEIFERNGVKIDYCVPHGIDTDFFKPGLMKCLEAKIVTATAWPGALTKGMHILDKALKKAKLTAKCISGVSRAEVRDALREASIFVFPSCYEETFGLCLAEAMACGLACIASDVAGAKYQAEQSNAVVIVPKRDPDALAEALHRLVTMPHKRYYLGLMARSYMEQHGTLLRMGQDYVKIYQELIG